MVDRLDSATDHFARKDRYRRDLIEQHVGLVSRVVNQMSEVYAQGRLDRDDVLGYGFEGLVHAAYRFDATRGVSFESFAVRRIRGAILDALRSIDPLPRSSRRKLQNLEMINIELAHMLGRWPTPKELAFRARLSVDEVDKILSTRGAMAKSLEAITADGSDEAIAWEIEDHDDRGDPVLAFENQALLEALAEAIANLSDRERALVEMRYQRDLPYRAIGRVLQMSESGAFQFHQRVVSKLRAGLEAGLNAA